MLAVLAGLSPRAEASPPLPARGTFVTVNYALTFRAPAGLSYCRLDDGWSGSDHGTILFLSPPSACHGAGFPSISRGFEPEGTPRIEVYYGHWDSDDAASPPPACHSIGPIRFLGQRRRLCVAKDADGMTEVTVDGHYTADSTAEAFVTLVTRQARLRHDLAVLRALIATIRSCTIPWRDAEKRTRVMGTGQPCPAGGDFY